MLSRFIPPNRRVESRTLRLIWSCAAAHLFTARAPWLAWRQYFCATMCPAFYFPTQHSPDAADYPGGQSPLPSASLPCQVIQALGDFCEASVSHPRGCRHAPRRALRPPIPCHPMPCTVSAPREVRTVVPSLAIRSVTPGEQHTCRNASPARSERAAVAPRHRVRVGAYGALLRSVTAAP